MRAVCILLSYLSFPDNAIGIFLSVFGWLVVVYMSVFGVKVCVSYYDLFLVHA